MADLIPQFFLAKTNMSEKSRSEYKRYLEDFVEWAGDPRAKDLTPDSVNEYVRQTKRRTLYGARFGCAVLKSFASWLADSGVLRTPTGGSVLRDVTTPRVPNEGRPPVSQEDIDRIISAIAGQPASSRFRDKALVLLLLTCGLRANEARMLGLRDLHLDAKTSWIEVRWNTSKGFASRRVRLDRIAANAINDYIEDHRVPFKGQGPEPLFTTVAGKEFRPGGFQAWCARLRDLFEEAGVHDWKAHRMRHTWASQFHRMSKETGVTVYDLKYEGGWKDLNIPLRYTKDRPWEELREMKTAFSLLEARRRAG